MKYLCEVKDPVATARLMRLFGWQVPLEDDLYKAYTIIVVKDKSLHNAYHKNSYGLLDIVGQTITEKELVELIVTGKIPEKPKISWSEVKVGETVNKVANGFISMSQMEPNKLYVIVGSTYDGTIVTRYKDTVLAVGQGNGNWWNNLSAISNKVRPLTKDDEIDLSPCFN